MTANIWATFARKFVAMTKQKKSPNLVTLAANAKVFYSARFGQGWRVLQVTISDKMNEDKEH